MDFGSTRVHRRFGARRRAGGDLGTEARLPGLIVIRVKKVRSVEVDGIPGPRVRGTGGTHFSGRTHFHGTWNRSHQPTLSTCQSPGPRLVVGSHTCAAECIAIDETGSRTRRQSQNPPLQKPSVIPALPWPQKITFEVFAGVGPDNSLERLTECSVGLVTDRPSNVNELLVTLFE